MDGVNPLVRALMSTTRDRHEDMRALVQGLADGGLTWSPAEDAPALAGLALHILDVERYVVSVATGEEMGWTGERGTHIRDAATEDDLVAAIEEMDRRIAAALGRLTNEHLAALTAAGDTTVGEAILEDLDHVAVHVGQMQLTRHLYEAAHPDQPRTYEHWR